MPTAALVSAAQKKKNYKKKNTPLPKLHSQ